MLFFEQTSNRRSGFLSTVAVIAAFAAGSADAQSLRNSQGPAEIPPTSYTANQFIDSRGCVYVRAGISGATSWVPRVSRTREQLCGFAPTLLAGTTPAPVAAPAPAPVQQAAAPASAPAATPTPAAAPVAAPVAASAPVAAPTPAAATPNPTAAVRAPAVLAPAVRAPAPAAAAPVQSAAASPRVITPPAAAPHTVTRAQACEGLTGVQTNFVSSRTGQPIDCGSAPTPQVAAATPRTVTRAQACEGLTGVQPNFISQLTGQPINCGGAATPQLAAAAPTSQPATTQRRLTRAQACADGAASGRQYVSTRTGLPIQCGGGRFSQIAAGLALPQQGYSNPLDLAPGSLSVPVQTASTSPRGYSNPLDSVSLAGGANTRPATSTDTVARARTATSNRGVIARIFTRNPLPYSNPTHAATLAVPVVPDGFDRVLDDGRFNPQRGLPSTPSRTARYATAPRVAAPVPQPTERAEQISGHRYVQVGTFTTRDQAQAIAQNLRARGLPMRVGVFDQNGQQMRIVLAGPFGNDGQLRDALGTTRGAGFSGAFTRR